MGDLVALARPMIREVEVWKGVGTDPRFSFFTACYSFLDA